MTITLTCLWLILSKQRIHFIMVNIRCFTGRFGFAYWHNSGILSLIRPLKHAFNITKQSSYRKSIGIATCNISNLQRAEKLTNRHLKRKISAECQEGCTIQLCCKINQYMCGLNLNSRIYFYLHYCQQLYNNNKKH